MKTKTDNKIIDRLAVLGIDRARLEACLDAKDNWGGMVYAFEYLSVLGTVLGVMQEAEAHG